VYERHVDSSSLGSSLSSHRQSYIGLVFSSRLIDLIINNKLSLYRFIINNNNSVVTSTSWRLHSEFVRLLFLHVHRETDRFFPTSGVQLPEHVSSTSVSQFSLHNSKEGGLTLGKVPPLRITLNLDGSPITSKKLI
jgi:hypothetical protein